MPVGFWQHFADKEFAAGRSVIGKHNSEQNWDSVCSTMF